MGWPAAIVAVLLAVVGTVWLRWDRRRSGTSGSATTSPSPDPGDPVVAWIAGGVAILTAVAALVAIVMTGHSGAEAVWGSRSASTDSASAPAITSRDGSYTLDQVAQHNTAASCWATINGDVFDLTSWIQSHPGGPNAIRSICGTDASTAFNNRHSTTPEAVEKLPDFQIGTLLR